MPESVMFERFCRHFWCAVYDSASCSWRSSPGQIEPSRKRNSHIGRYRQPNGGSTTWAQTLQMIECVYLTCTIHPASVPDLREDEGWAAPHALLAGCAWRGQWNLLGSDGWSEGVSGVLRPRKEGKRMTPGGMNPYTPAMPFRAISLQLPAQLNCGGRVSYRSGNQRRRRSACSAVVCWFEVHTTTHFRLVNLSSVFPTCIDEMEKKQMSASAALQPRLSKIRRHPSTGHLS
jgi:hypothetical protein